MKTLLVSAAIFATAALGSGAVSAAPIGSPGAQAPAAESLATKVATLVCTRDDRGWHRMRGNRRITCRPARPRGSFWGWHCEGPRCGWWHRKERRFYD